MVKTNLLLLSEFNLKIIMTKLSVNINKIATLRNARGGNNPDLIQFARDCEKFGADGITIHPRPDERHIRKEDVGYLKKVVEKEFNIEGYPSKEFIKLILMIHPTQVTLVPDPPHVLTSTSGWDIKKNKQFLNTVLKQFQSTGIRTSIFINPELEMVKRAKEIGSDRIELYTGPYANNYNINKEMAIEKYIKASNLANEIDLDINAGHDLNLINLNYFIKKIPTICEVSIGHALICDTLYFGLKNTIESYKKEL